MFHDGTHMVDLFYFFAGDPHSAIGLADRSHGERFIENTTTGIFNYPNGAKGLILAGGEREYFHFEIDIHTSKARALLGNHVSELYVSNNSKRFTGFRELEKVPFPKSGDSVNAYVGGIDDLIRQMETGAASLSGGEDGYKALEGITALYRSAAKSGATVKLPLRA